MRVKRACVDGWRRCARGRRVLAQATTGSISGTVDRRIAAPSCQASRSSSRTSTPDSTRTQVTDTQRAAIACSTSTPGNYELDHRRCRALRPSCAPNLTVAIGKDLLVDVELKVGGARRAGDGRGRNEQRVARHHHRGRRRDDAGRSPSCRSTAAASCSWRRCSRASSSAAPRRATSPAASATRSWPSAARGPSRRAT